MVKNVSFGFLAFLAGVVFGFGSLSALHYYSTVETNHFVKLSPAEKSDTSIRAITTKQQTEALLKQENLQVSVVRTNASNDVRVFCWVMTTPVNLQKKTIFVKNTWAKRCTYTAFFSSVDDPFPTIGLKGVKEGRDQLYEKTKAAFKYLWDCCRDDADWFMKADDDTYVIVENLKYMLRQYNSSMPLYFGRRFKPFMKQGYMSGGAGYVISKEGLKRFVEGIDSKKCPKGGAVEDVEFGKCMEVMGVKATDTRDENQRETFFPLSMIHMIEGNIPGWFWKYIFYPAKPEDPCCSYRPISFHYVSGKQMLVYEYVIYGMKLKDEMINEAIFLTVNSTTKV